jgi:hypothetical protein
LKTQSSSSLPLPSSPHRPFLSPSPLYD